MSFRNKCHSMEEPKQLSNTGLEETYDPEDIISPSGGCFFVIVALPFIICALPFLLIYYVWKEIIGSNREKRGLTRYKQ